MTNSNNITKTDKRTQALTEDEIQKLKTLSKEAKSFTEFAMNVRVERVALTNTIIRGTAAPETVKKIRKFLQLQTA